MKKTLLFLLIVLCCVIVHSQNSIIKQENDKIKPYYAIELNCGMIIPVQSSYIGPSVGFNSIYGIQFNYHLALALDLSFNYSFLKDLDTSQHYIPYLKYKYHSLSLGQGLSLRYFILKQTAWTALLTFNIGVNERVLYDLYYAGWCNKNALFDFQYSMGLHFGVMRRFDNGKDFYITVGYTVNDIHSLGIKAGFHF